MAVENYSEAVNVFEKAAKESPKFIEDVVSEHVG